MVYSSSGDYDGDKAIVIWDSEIVDCFANAPDKYSNEPEEIESCFTRDDTTVANFLAEFVDAPPAAKAQNKTAAGVQNATTDKAGGTAGSGGTR